MMNYDALSLPADSRVLCAVSGGADSVALLHMCAALREQGRLRWLGAAHYHHGLRGQAADGDESFVRGLCADWDVPFYTERGDTAAAAGRRGMGIEEAARALRYAFLQKTAKEAGADTLLTAHNADDNWETMLLNLTRGTGLDGLCGIPPTRDCQPYDAASDAQTVDCRLIRPLLGLTRADILAYLDAHGQSFREDESNTDTAFTRNRIRHEVLPILREINPKAAQSALQAAALLRADAAYLDAEADRQVRQYGTGSAGHIRFPLEELSGLPPSIASRIVRALCRSVGWHSPSQAHVQAILDIGASRSPHAAAPVPKGWSARREYGHLCVSQNRLDPHEAESGRETRYKSKLIVRAMGLYNPENVYKSFNSFYVAGDTIVGKIHVRTRRTGDRITLEHARGSKSLNRLMIDRKIPLCDRSQIAVLADDAGIVAVDGLGIDKSRVPREGEKVLELTLEE